MFCSIVVNRAWFRLLDSKSGESSILCNSMKNIWKKRKFFFYKNKKRKNFFYKNKTGWELIPARPGNLFVKYTFYTPERIRTRPPHSGEYTLNH